MTMLTVESVKLTQTQKAYSVKSATGKYYVAGKDIGIEQVQPGSTIDAVIGSFQGKDGKTISTIDGFSLAEPQKQPVANPGLPASPANGDRWWVPFVSNQCAHAIQCGLIKELGDLSQWARAAKLAIISADQMDSDDTPF